MRTSAIVMCSLAAVFAILLSAQTSFSASTPPARPGHAAKPPAHEEQFKRYLPGYRVDVEGLSASTIQLLLSAFDRLDHDRPPEATTIKPRELMRLKIVEGAADFSYRQTRRRPIADSMSGISGISENLLTLPASFETMTDAQKLEELTRYLEKQFPRKLLEADVHSTELQNWKTRQKHRRDWRAQLQNILPTYVMRSEASTHTAVMQVIEAFSAIEAERPPVAADHAYSDFAPQMSIEVVDGEVLEFKIVEYGGVDPMAFNGPQPTTRARLTVPYKASPKTPQEKEALQNLLLEHFPTKLVRKAELRRAQKAYIAILNEDQLNRYRTFDPKAGLSRTRVALNAVANFVKARRCETAFR